MQNALLKSLVDLVYPKVCLSCKDKINEKTKREFICSQCYNAIEKNVPPFCHSCGRHLEKTNISKSICPTCLKNRFHFDRAYSPCRYTGAVKELIREFKYNGKEYLGDFLSQFLIDFIKEYSLPIEYIDLIIPMPLHQARLREREFNQAEVLSKYIGTEFNAKVATDILLRRRHTASQTDLEHNERLLNVKGSFKVGKENYLKNKNCLLVDDVLTTGATSSEAAFCLKEAGANVVFVLTIAN
jgi:ComF family protein